MIHDHLHNRGTDRALRDLEAMPPVPPSVGRELNERLELIAACRADAAHWKDQRDSLPDNDKFKHRRAALAACIDGSEMMARSMEVDPENAPGYLQGFAKRKAGMAALDDTDLCPWCGVGLCDVAERDTSDDNHGGRIVGRECQNPDCPHDWLDVDCLSESQARAVDRDRAADVAEENARAARGGGVA